MTNRQALRWILSAIALDAVVVVAIIVSGVTPVDVLLPIVRALA